VTVQALNADRVVVVTGAASGIGEAVAQMVLAEGYRLVAVDRDAGVDRFAGPRAQTHTVDVTDATAIDAVVAEVAEGPGQLYGLVNVAGIHRLGTILTATVRDWEDVLGVNLMGTVNWTRAVLPYLVAQRLGVIVNFASIAATHARPNSVAYVTAKTAVLGFTRAVALDFGGDGVRCVSVSPGTTETPMIRATSERGGAALTEQAAGNPMKRMGSPAELAGAVKFLLSDDAGYVNGANLVVDGGRTAAT
jgi:NAD(P)-dependent dehydrogenase (short-subunit alcohol dehydrogenase family)